jgi:hypothetical protein
LEVEVADRTREEVEIADQMERKKNVTKRKKTTTSEYPQQHTSTHNQRQRSSPPAAGGHHQHHAETRRHRSLTRKKWIELGEEKERIKIMVGLRYRGGK